MHYKLFLQRVRTAVQLMVVGAGLTYLGILSWYMVGVWLGFLLGAPGALVLFIGINIGLSEGPLQQALEGIEQALRSGSPKVHLQSVRETTSKFRAWNLRVFKDRSRSQFSAMQEAILIWDPLYDRVVKLFVETIEGEHPSLRTGPDGKPF
jgi:hypothetical protein